MKLNSLWRFRSSWADRADASWLTQAAFILALVAPLAVFIFEQQAMSVVAALGLEGKLFPSAILLAQYDTLLNCGWLTNVFDSASCKDYMSRNLSLSDFQLFELLIGIFLAFGFARIAVDIFRLEKLDGYAEEIRRRGLVSILVLFFVAVPIAMYIAVDVRVAAQSFPGNYLIMYSPRAYLGVAAFLFGVMAAFQSAGIVFVFWLLFRRRSLEARLRGVNGR